MAELPGRVRPPGGPPGKFSLTAAERAAGAEAEAAFPALADPQYGFRQIGEAEAKYDRVLLHRQTLELSPEAERLTRDILTVLKQVGRLQTGRKEVEFKWCWDAARQIAEKALGVSDFDLGV